jgi:uncharacterized lipoprotein YmbA
MGKWMSAVAAVVVVGCGIEPADQAAPALPKSTTQEQQPAVAQQQAQPPSRVKPDLAAAAERLNPRETVNVTVQLQNVTGTTARVVLGQSGCGFGTFGGGEAAVKDGVAEVNLSGIPANMDWVDMIVFQDADGDGQCTAADSLWTARLQTTSFNSRFTYDLSKLDKAEAWMCFPFNLEVTP